MGLSLGISTSSSAQLVKEQLFPAMPFPSISVQIIAAHNSFYVCGYSTKTWPYFDGEQSASIPFFLLTPQSSAAPVVLLPDTAYSRAYAFSYTFDDFTVCSAVNSDDSLFVAWSKMTYFESDVPGTDYANPNASIGKVVNGKLERILSMNGGLHPSIAVDGADVLHVVWEVVTPLSPDPIFSKYASEILYQKRTEVGKFSDTVKVGKGVFPQLLQNQNVLYCLYFQADSTTQPVSHLVLQRINAGTFESPVALCEIRSPIQISRYPYLDRIPLSGFVWGVDGLGGVHVCWSTGSSSGKVYILHYHDAVGVQIDSTPSYYLNFPKYLFTSDGEVRMFALTQDSYNVPAVLRYEVSKQGTVLEEKQDIPLPSNSMTLPQVISDHAGNQYALLTDLSSGATSYLIKNVGTTDTSITMFTDVYFLGTSSYLDQNNTVWLTGVRDSTSVLLSFSLSGVGRVNDSGIAIAPQQYNLAQNYPNPFNPATNFRFVIPKLEVVSLKIYDLLGREVARLVEQRLAPGEYSARWDASKYPSGVYIYQLSVGGHQLSKKMMLLK